VRICVIFNPTARGDKARSFRHHLDEIAGECALKQTVAAGGARPLAAEAIREGFDTIIAAGGDGTLNETLNGIGDVPDGFERARLGVLPLGTVNVFAKELGMPTSLKQAWQVLRAGRETKIDLPTVEYTGPNGPERRYFAQLAGSGLDARAIALTDWQVKKTVGPLAYIWAGVRALTGPPSRVTAANGVQSETGELVLIGNGRFYGGKYPVHPRADLGDGLLEVCIFPKTNWLTLFRCANMFMFGSDLPAGVARSFRANSFTLNSDSPTPLEVDGENVGHLPAIFSIQRQKLRVVIP
jgi:YegS/Rv2252/BmrU family lipid kinase